MRHEHQRLLLTRDCFFEAGVVCTCTYGAAVSLVPWPIAMDSLKFSQVRSSGDVFAMWERRSCVGGCRCVGGADEEEVECTCRS